MKKIIAVLTVISMVFAFSACSSKKYKETEATVPVTNEQGETVTNSNGEVVTEIITTDGETTVVSSSQTDTSSTSTAADASTTKKASSKTDKSSSASNAETTKKSSSSTSVKTTKSADKSSGEQSSNAAELTTGGKTQNNAASVSTSGASQSTTKKGDATTKKDTTTTTTKPTTTKPATTEKPKKRDIKVKVVLPFYNDEEARVKISYKTAGDDKADYVMFADPDNSKKEIDYKTAKLDGKTTVNCTIENVKGDVSITVNLLNFSGKDNIKNNNVTVKSNETEVTITPLTGIGMINGDDESLD